MHLTVKQLLGGAVILSAVIGTFYIVQGKRETPAGKPRSMVQVVRSGIAEQKDMAVTLTANGYVTAFKTVEVRPQVQNVIRSIHVKEGQEVKAGQLLFTLDQRLDQSEVNKAMAQLARNRADLAEAEASLGRNQELLAKNFVSQAVVDAARSRVAALRSTLQGDQAAIRSSQVGLSHNTIAASMSGRLGAISVHPGSLVQPSGMPMVTIAQLDPVSVSFSVPERELEHIRMTYPNGNAPVVAQLASGREMTGKLHFIDNAADPQTGTIRMKAQFANPERWMWPGAFATVRLVTRMLLHAVVIPAQAIVTGPADKFVYMVQPDETVKPQSIQVLTIDKGRAAISGIAAGARVVIEGNQNLLPGSKVKEAAVPGAEQRSLHGYSLLQESA